MHDNLNSKRTVQIPVDKQVQVAEFKKNYLTERQRLEQELSKPYVKDVTAEALDEVLKVLTETPKEQIKYLELGEQLINYVELNRALTERMNRVLDENRSEYRAVDSLKGKAKAGYRKIPLSTEANLLFDSLLAERNHMNENCTNKMKNYLFKSATGKFVTDDTFNRKLRAVCREANVEYKSSHAIRFTTATLLFNAGIELTEISKIWVTKI